MLHHERSLSNLSNLQWKWMTSRGSDGVTVVLTLMHTAVPAVISRQMCACEPKLPCQHPCSSSSHLPLHAAVFLVRTLFICHLACLHSLSDSFSLWCNASVLVQDYPSELNAENCVDQEEKEKYSVQALLRDGPKTLCDICCDLIGALSGVFEILGDKFLIHCLWAPRSFMRMNKLKICLRCLNPFFGRARSQNV